MSESGESQPQDDSDEDIYKDFADFNFGDELAKLEHSKETIKKEALDLSEQVKVLTKENEELRKSNDILKKNMSSLLKTAQSEIQRKDSMIQELRKEIDSFTFRRRNKITKDIFTSTQDLEVTVKMKNGSAEIKSVNDKKRSKSKEYRSSSESERKSYQKEQRKKEFEGEKESLNCDNNRKFGYYRDCTRRKSRFSDGHYSPNNQKESHYRDNSKKNEADYRVPFSDNHKGHLKYHSLDRRKRSRSSDRRFTYRRKSSRTRRSERLEEYYEKLRREKKEDIFENVQRRRHSGKHKSRSRECSKGSKESSLDPPKSRSSSDKDSSSRNKESSNKLKETNSVKIDSDENKKGKGYPEKEKSEKNEVKTSAKGKRIPKEENSGKNEKPSELDKFCAKSPLDALYNEMLTSRSATRFSKLGSGVNKPEPDPEEDKTAQKEDSNLEEEDWALSFKNERQDKARPMTLYSRRMMQKLSEAKVTEKLSSEEKAVPRNTSLKEIKKTETEKEPGELTDDESVIESSKEFQELTKVALIESATLETPKETEPFKEPMAKEELIVKNKTEIESRVEESNSSNEVQREIRDVIEYSPFKNNYKLIEISPIKPPDKEHIMELHHKKTSTGPLQKEVESSIFNLLSSLSGVPFSSKVEEPKVEESKEVHDDSENKHENKMEPLQNEKTNEKIESKPRSRKNSKSKKSDVQKPGKKVKSVEENESKKSDETVTPGEATQFLDFFLLTTSPSKPIIPEQPETPGKIEKAANSSDPKSDSINSSTENIEDKNSRISPKKESAKIKEERKKTKKNESEKTAQKNQEKTKDVKKAKGTSKKENENKPNSKIQKRKRDSESEPETKKPRLEESPRKRTRSQLNSGNKIEKPKPESQSEPKTKVKEDITTFEFFKPIAKKDSLDTPTECKMAAMSVANIVCLETPSKGGTNLKNLMINEQMILNVLDSKNPAMCSPLMTPRRLLKNDLMLTDSEDDSGNKGNVEEEEGNGMSESENSECESDSGASDFVDLL